MDRCVRKNALAATRGAAEPGGTGSGIPDRGTLRNVCAIDGMWRLMQALGRSHCLWIIYLLAFALCGRPSSVSAEDAPDGRVLYRRYCASCHGESGHGDGPDARIFASRPRNLHDGFLGKYKTDDLVKRVRQGRSLELALDLPSLKKRASEVESVVAHMRRLPALNWSEIGPGWDLYLDRCEACHGAYGTPPTKLPAGVRRSRDLSTPAFQESISDAELGKAVRQGHHHMPALVPRVSEPEVIPLTSFVRLLSPGFELYSRYCSVCHGDDGYGACGLGEPPRVPTVAFDRTYFSRRSPEEIRDAVWHMIGDHKPAMPHFRWTLSDAQTRAIVDYLKRTEPSPK